MLTIDFEPPAQSEPCECCGGRTTSLTRFVHSDGNAFAIYYARFSENHAERVVVATVSIGEWGEDSTPEQRCAFVLRLWPDCEHHNVTVLDAADSPWRDATLIGRTLDRVEAMAHPRLQDVFHIADHMVLEDAPLRDYLEGGSHAG
jgi:hypothetical protein